jgi:hypothetical protein
LVSVSAAALIAGAGIASAQDKGGPAAAPQNSSPAQQSAPPSSQPNRGAAPGGQTEQRQDAPPARAEQGRDQKQQRAQESDQERNQRGDRAQDKSGPKAGSTATDSKSDRKGGATTGQGAAGSGGGSLTAEQRTKVSTTIRQTNVKKVTNVNFNVSVGTVVPRGVTLHALPATVIEVYPQWRGYQFVMVEDEILIIEPGSNRIVAVIDA